MNKQPNSMLFKICHISDCGKNGGRGGLGRYYGSVEISNYSSLIADDNEYWDSTWRKYEEGSDVPG